MRVIRAGLTFGGICLAVLACLAGCSPEKVNRSFAVVELPTRDAKWSFRVSIGSALAQEDLQPLLAKEMEKIRQLLISRDPAIIAREREVRSLRRDLIAAVPGLQVVQLRVEVVPTRGRTVDPDVREELEKLPGSLAYQ